MNDLKKFEDMPGPYGLPLLGSVLHLRSYQGRVLTEWGNDFYGKVFRYRFFTKRCIVLNGYEAVKEGLVKNKDSMSGRMTGEVLKATRDNQGIFFANFGENWRKWRSFAANSFRRTAEDMAKIIGNEARLFEEHSLDEASESGNPVSLDDMIATFSEVIFKICDSKLRGDEPSHLQDVMPIIYAQFSSPSFLVLMFSPSLSRFPPFSRYLPSATEYRLEIVKRLVAWIDDYKKDDTKTDILSVFYEENPEPSTEDKESLAYAIMDMLFAGSATVGNQFSWIILFLVKNPEVLRRVQEEIDENMKNTKNNHPYELYSKCSELPFTNAVIQEVYRLRPIAPTSLQHTTTAKTSVCGYEVPKDIVVFPNIWSVHHDKEFWGPDVEMFKPERHIGDDGQYMKSDHVIPFSVGARSCVGEMIARADVFIYLVTILHKYNLKLVEDSTELDMKGRSGSILQPPPYKVKVTKR